MNKKTIWIVIGAVVVLVLAGAVVAKSRGKKAMEVQVAKVDRHRIIQKVNATGKIKPKTQVEISADVSGKITKLGVKEGQWVEKGAMLVSIASDRYRAAVESAEANVSAAEANATLVRENLTRTEKEYKRSKELLANGNESQAAFDAKSADYSVEQARYKSTQDQVAQAQAALKQARDDLSKTTIFSPMAGTISTLPKEEGEIALGSQFQKDVIMTVADLTQMEAQVDVDENDIGDIAIGQKAEIEVDALPGKTLNGIVSENSNSANQSGNGSTEQKTEFAIKITIVGPPPTLRPGMTATAEIITKTEDNAVSVPIQSVAARAVDQLAKKGQKRKDAEGSYKPDKDGFVEVVFCVKDGKAVAKQVKTGIQSDELIQITDGLQPGEEIVTGSYRAISKDLENGAAITVGKGGPKDKDGPGAGMKAS